MATASAQQINTKETLIPPRERLSAPEFSLTDVQGQPLKLAQYKGRVVLLDFWATTCGGCKLELPWYVEFRNKYGKQGLSPIGLDMYGETPEVVRQFAQRWSMQYPLAIGTDAVGAMYHLGAMPLTVLIDRQGRIALSRTGVVDKQAFEANLQQLLHE